MKRREFFKKGVASVAVLSGFTVIPSFVLGKPLGHVPPSEKINLACIGIGNRGADIIKKLHCFVTTKRELLSTKIPSYLNISICWT